MAIKNFITNNTYSRIERVYVNKKDKRVDFNVFVYKDNTCEDILIQELLYSLTDNPQHSKCKACENGFVMKNTQVTDEHGATDTVKQNFPCEICGAAGYIAKNEFSEIIAPALKTDQNILALCYVELMKRPEFAGTEGC
jgi:hypothetical protein